MTYLQHIPTEISSDPPSSFFLQMFLYHPLSCLLCHEVAFELNLLVIEVSPKWSLRRNLSRQRISGTLRLNVGTMMTNLTATFDDLRHVYLLEAYVVCASYKSAHVLHFVEQKMRLSLAYIFLLGLSFPQCDACG